MSTDPEFDDVMWAKTKTKFSLSATITETTKAFKDFGKSLAALAKVQDKIAEPDLDVSAYVPSSIANYPGIYDGNKKDPNKVEPPHPWPHPPPLVTGHLSSAEFKPTISSSTYIAKPKKTAQSEGISVVPKPEPMEPAYAPGMYATTGEGEESWGDVMSTGLAIGFSTYKPNVDSMSDEDLQDLIAKAKEKLGESIEIADAGDERDIDL